MPPWRMPSQSPRHCAPLPASPGPDLYCKHAAGAAEADEDFEAGPSDEEQDLSGASSSDASGSEREDAGGSGGGGDGDDEVEEDEDDFGSGECDRGASVAWGLMWCWLQRAYCTLDSMVCLPCAASPLLPSLQMTE